MTLVNEKLSQKPLNNDPRNGIFHFIKRVAGIWKSFGLKYEDLVDRLNQDLTIDANVTPVGSDGDVQLNVNGELGVDADLHFDNIEKVLDAGRTVQHDAALKEIKIGFPSQDYAAEALLNGREANANLNGFARFGVPLVKKQHNITAALALSGTATGGSTTTLVDSGASFTSEVEGKVVEITYQDASRVGTYVLTATATELTLGHTLMAVTAGCTYKILSTIELNNEQLDSYVYADTTNDSAGLILPTLHSDVFNATVNAIVAATAGDNRFYIVLKGNANVRGSSFAFLNKLYQATELASKSETRWDVVSTEAAGLELSPAGATGDIQLNDGAGGLGVADAGVGKYEGDGAWTFGTGNSAIGNNSFVAGGIGNTASGAYSSLVGGSGNKATTGSSSVIGGTGNTASGGSSSVIGGSSNKASGSYSSVIGGSSNTASGAYSSVVGGTNNTASGNYSVSFGSNAIAKTTTEIAHGGGANSERRMNVLKADSTDANPTLLKLADGTYFVLPNTISGWAFKVKVVGVKDDGSSAAFFFEGCIQRKSDTTVSFAGTPLKTSYIDASLTGVDAAVIANDTDKRLDIQVTGLAETNIRWTAVVDVAQSVWGAW